MIKNSKNVIEFRPRVAPKTQDALKPLCSARELREYKETLEIISIAEAELARLNQAFAKRIKEGGYSLPGGYYFDEIMGLTPVKEEAVAVR